MCLRRRLFRALEKKIKNKSKNKNKKSIIYKSNFDQMKN